MELLLDRKWKNCKREDGTTYCIGRLYIDGTFFSNTIEDEWRGLDQRMSETEIKQKKVYGLTCIPSGRYKVEMSYSNKFKKRMPYITGVKGFTGIMMHNGTTEKDSLGCVIVGRNSSKGMVTESKKTTAELITILERATSYNAPIYITIQ